MSEFNNVFTQLSSFKFTSATLTSINSNKQDLNTYFIPSSSENLSKTSQNTQYISFNNNKDEKEVSINNKKNISDKNNDNNSKNLNSNKGDTKGIIIEPICSNCLKLKRSSCAEILRSFYFESLTSLHNHHMFDQHKISTSENHLNASKTHSSHSKLYNISDRSINTNKQQTHFDQKFHTIGHSKRLHSHHCIVCNELFKDHSFKNYRSKKDLSSDSSEDEDDFLIIREANDGYANGTLKKTFNEEMPLELAKFSNKVIAIHYII